MAERLDVLKTYKLYIGGAFPRSESGRSLPVFDARGGTAAHISHGSRKDLRDAVEAARGALGKWSGASAYNRGQVLYRMAEMLQGRRDEFMQILLEKATSRPSSRSNAKPSKSGRSRSSKAAIAPSRAEVLREIDASIDRLVCFAGWADKYAQVLGCNNPVAGPYYNFTVPEPSGVVAIVAPDEPALLGMVSMIASPLCAGCTVVALASETFPIAGAVFGEVCSTSDLPAGAVNILTTQRDELLQHIAEHREIDAISAAHVSSSQRAMLRAGAGENLKRVHVAKIDGEQWLDPGVCESPWAIEPYVEMKTIWHPSAV